MPNRLSEYRRRRDFAATPEPEARPRRGPGSGARYVIHLHHARHRHFDLRLQVGDSLRSWAVPKGPSLDPQQKRLAVEVEDHPLDYAGFEGTIPEGHYGAGEVWIWDQGRWKPEGDPRRALKEGRLHFELDGQRLHGGWSLVRTRLNGKKPQWLLMKSRDEAVSPGDEADDTPLSEWHGKSPARRKAAPSAARGGKAEAAGEALPQSIGLQLARLSERAPAGRDWLHEVKFDGYRVLLWRNGDRVRITSRGDQDWTGKLRAAADAVRRLPCERCVLDGELVAVDSHGRSHFGKLQQQFGESANALTVMVFDLLHLDGEDCRPLPQIERKRRLAALFRKSQAPLQLTAYVTGNGATAARQACAGGLEGIISKKADAPYQEGRGGAWLKTKCVQSEEYAVLGYTTGKGVRTHLGSLLLGRPGAGPRDPWRYFGRVGTGLDEAMIEDLLQRLSVRKEPVPLENPPQRTQLRGAVPRWVEPELVVEVEFRGFTEDRLLRQASVKGLREDRSVASLKPAQRDKARSSAGAVARKQPPKRRAEAPPKRAPARRIARTTAAPAEFRLTHPDRLLFQDPPITKQQLADFYRGIADHILPCMAGRPLLLLRCPDGGAGACFFQKHLSPGFPPAVHEVADPAEKQRWIYIDDLEGLLSLVQMNALEYHVWGSTAADLDHADRLVFDLDPADDVPWKQVVQGALNLRQRLEAVKLRSFVRTTGGKGLHVVVPLRPAQPWDAARAFAHALADAMAQEQPQHYIAVASKARRGGKIFVDYLRNGRGATAVTSYSLRNRPGAPIAVPLSWDELPRLRSPQQFGYANIRRRLDRLAQEPWHGIERIKQVLPES